MSAPEITGCALARVEGPLFAQDARRVWRRRRLLILRIEAGGRFGLGEASPLPEYSPDSFEDTEAALAALPLRGRRLRGPLSSWLSLLPEALPAARFGLETALLSLMAQGIGGLELGPEAAAVLPELRAPGPAPEAAALISGPPAGWLEAAEAAVGAGRRCLKLKLGRDFAAELAALQALRARFGSQLRLRLDVNQAWPAEGLSDKLAALSAVSPDFVEEPTRPEAWPAAAPVLLGRDESLRGGGAQPAAVVVLKPSLLGGGAAALRCATEIPGADRVWSHAYEGQVGYRAICAWARAWPGARASGLGPHPALGLDLPQWGG